jgi:hypothetical protein
VKRTGISIGLELLLLIMGSAIAFHGTSAGPPSVPKVVLLQTPKQGIQPQTVLEQNGTLHMIYFLGDPSAGDIEYVRRDPAGSGFSRAIRVNSVLGSAVAIGTVRGPQLTVGRNGRAYVIWFGPQPKSDDPTATMPVFFARLNDSGTAFEPQRNLMQYARGGDGGLSAAADLRGNVYSVWHAIGAKPGDDNRRVYLARSADDGKTFTREVPISPPELGACGCCGMRAFADEHGTLYVLYRAAAQNIHRDMTLLASTDRGRTFRAVGLAPWELSAGPMSTAYLSEGGHRVWAAWEKAGEVYFEQIDANAHAVSPPIDASGDGSNRKHPAVAANTDGKVLMAWTEGTGWHKGGSLAWQLFDSSGKPLAAKSYLPRIPAWDLPAVFADHDGNFTVVY